MPTKEFNSFFKILCRDLIFEGYIIAKLKSKDVVVLVQYSGEDLSGIAIMNYLQPKRIELDLLCTKSGSKLRLGENLLSYIKLMFCKDCLLTVDATEESRGFYTKKGFVEIPDEFGLLGWSENGVTGGKSRLKKSIKC